MCMKSYIIKSPAGASTHIAKGLIDFYNEAAQYSYHTTAYLLNLDNNFLAI